MTPNTTDCTFPAEPLQATEIQLLCEGQSKGFSGVRNVAIIILLWRTGLRISEALSLRPSDIDWTRRSVRIRSGKGGKAGTSFFDEGVEKYLRAWQDVRGRQAVGTPFFCTTKGTSCSRQLITKALKRVAVEQGIEKRVSPHQFRHTHAFELAGEGVPIHVISRQLRHSNVSVTNRYINHLGASDVQDAIAGRAF